MSATGIHSADPLAAGWQGAWAPGGLDVGDGITFRSWQHLDGTHTVFAYRDGVLLGGAAPDVWLERILPLKPDSEAER